MERELLLSAGELEEAVRGGLGSLAETCRALERLFRKYENEANAAHLERLRLHHVSSYEGSFILLFFSSHSFST